MSDFVLTMSPTVGKIFEALAKAQLQMRPASKDSKNPHFKNTYASLTSCIEACRPLLEHGIAVLQPPVSHGPDGVTVTTLLGHSSGEWVRGELYMPASKKDPQGFGSALSYARRYCLTSTVGIGADDDDAETSVRPAPVNDLTPVLAESVAWGSKATVLEETLTSAKTMGELLEAWAQVSRATKDAPPGILKRLSITKDKQKAALTGTR
jgi:hypothetical protein